MLPHFWPEKYRSGVSNIKDAIESGLASAGADMANSSVFLPKKYLQLPGVPARMDIAAVPCDAPKFVVKFTQQEIMDSAAGIEREDVREKISRYALAYAQYRNSPERSARLLSSFK